jgi:hypothetical protein
VTGKTERLWRLRKDSTWIDARLCEDAFASTVELQFFYDGSMLVARKWPSRQAAVADAEDQRRALQRAGWNTHW